MVWLRCAMYWSGWNFFSVTGFYRVKEQVRLGLGLFLTPRNEASLVPKSTLYHQRLLVPH